MPAAAVESEFPEKSSFRGLSAARGAHGMTGWRMFGATACLGLTACAAISQPSADQQLWDRLTQGGYVILMPHANALVEAPSRPSSAPEQCRNQRYLSSRGQRQAQWLRDGLQGHAVSVGRVLSSHDCRCIETAGAVFGQAEPWSIIDDTLDGDAEMVRQRSIALREAISRWTSGSNLAMVSHQAMIRKALGIATRPAEALVIEPLGDAGFRLVGRLQSHR